MREPIYLIVDRNKVVRMVKTLGSLAKGQIPIKLTVEVKPAAFREPTIEREVIVDDWSTGIDISDVTFEKNIITEKEAEIGRKIIYIHPPAQIIFEIGKAI